MVRELGEVTVQARQFFRDIGAIGKERDFLHQPLVVYGDRQPRLLNAVEQRRAMFFHDIRVQRANLLERFAHCLQTVN